MANGGRRTWLRALVALLLLAVVAGAVALFVLSSRPEPAPTDGGKPVGTVSGGGADGKRTYQASPYRFRLRYPSEWRLTESGAAKAPEGDYLTLTLVPRRTRTPAGSSAGKTLTPLVIEVVPDPQDFTASDVVRMKWGSLPATLTVSTQTVDIAGTDGVEVRLVERTPREGSRYRYEAIAVVGRRMFLAHFESTDAGDFEDMARESRRVMRSLDVY